MERMVRTVEALDYHRNGVGGNGFHVVLFTDTEGRRMLATVFQDDGDISVLDRDLLAAGNIRFGENSWRYENYAGELRALVGAWDDSWKPGEGESELTPAAVDRILGEAGYR